MLPKGKAHKLSARRLTILGLISIGPGLAVVFLGLAFFKATSSQDYLEATTQTAQANSKDTADYCLEVSPLECGCRRYGKAAFFHSGLSREVKLSQTAPNGFTFTLEHLYADANLVLLSYSYRSPAGYNYTPYRLVLTDEAGKPLKELGGATSPLVVGQITEVKGYDATVLKGQGNPAQVKLRLEILALFGGAVPATPVSTTAISPSSGRAGTLSPGPTPTPTYRATPAPSPIATNLAFEVEVPFQAGRVARPQLKTEGEGNSNGNGGAEESSQPRLEQIVVTPSQVKFYVRGVGSAPLATLTLIGWNSAADNQARWSSQATEAGLQALSFDTMLAWQKRGEEAILTIKPNPNGGRLKSFGTATLVAGGPWRFRFTLP